MDNSTADPNRLTDKKKDLAPPQQDAPEGGNKEPSVETAMEKLSVEKRSVETETERRESLPKPGDAMSTSITLTYAEELMMNNVFQDTELSIDPKTIQLLTDGFISKFLPSLQKAKTTVGQITSSQNVLIETVQQEISKFTECQALSDLDRTMTKAKVYQNKLMKLRREMTNLHEKSRKLKKRALKLQQLKQKEELTRAHNLEKEYEKERLLTARLAPASE